MKTPKELSSIGKKSEKKVEKYQGAAERGANAGFNEKSCPSIKKEVISPKVD